MADSPASKPTGLAILLGAGPATGAGIARVLADPAQGNMAIALLARRPEPLHALAAALRATHPAATVAAFPTSTAPAELRAAFAQIRAHAQLGALPLRLAVFSIKNSDRKPFLDETFEQFVEPLTTYVGGAMVFAQESIRLMLETGGREALAEGAEKKGTLVFTGTLGALRCNAEFASYGASRSSVRQLAQALAREMSPKGIHVAHCIANGRIVDADNADTAAGKHMAAEAVGRTYLWLARQDPTLWTHELDMRPAQEKF